MYINLTKLLSLILITTSVTVFACLSKRNLDVDKINPNSPTPNIIKDAEKELDPIKESRIKFVEKTSIDNNCACFYIISIDGKEYLAKSNGGICPLVIKK